ncbi:MAG: SGNH/GDSL hydrolase family protein [Mariniblastus sp.]|nr:SGNH/GDSL hydrolase family protein [Mariniblastus sp.]
MHLLSSRPTRRRFLEASAALSTLAFSPLAWRDQNQTDEITWYNAQEWGVEGKGFADTARYYDRLPARAEAQVRKAVWDLSRHSSGMSTRFKTNARSIHVRYRLSSQQLAMPHMPATGVSGVDLYARDEASGGAQDLPGRWRWAAVAMPRSQEVSTRLIRLIRPRANDAARDYLLYLPLYNGIESLEIGVDKQAQFTGVAPRPEKPIVFYGTSIMHGACASRPGMSISSILGRRLDRPVINLGFSGNGTMETSVGEFLVELDPAIYVIDCLPNMNAQQVKERCQALVDQLRQKRPKTPILLVADRVNAGAWLRTGSEEFHQGNRQALQAEYRQMVAEGRDNLHYLDGQELIGKDGEATTDGSHPSDLGMVRYADAYEPVLRRLLAAGQ